MLDQYYFMHSNKLVLFGLSEKHEVIVNSEKNPIVSVTFDANKTHRSQKQVKGKHKSKLSIKTINFILQREFSTESSS